ncbi:apolipoprotein N-acyltransferase [Lebetimonas natsushimae]|uniref:Apolipoprotein N-acyltransferase n=1 Tax=Lebetimonas natsushimae TaxID=1936991 RepID=A0A292YCG5_9BACT|nr:apolipoprotein N-acyltransferase [Lebetimonas natsushimae]
MLLRIKNSCVSFFRRYFNTNSLIVATFVSLPIYLNFFLLKFGSTDNFLTEFIFTFLLLLALFVFFYKKHSFFQTGFFIGIFWFYWIGLSFRFYNLTFLIPFVILIIGLFYGSVFWLIKKIESFIKNVYLKKIYYILIFTFAFDYLTPFTFDWLKPEILFVNSFYGVDKITLFIVFFSILFYEIDKKFLLLLFIPLFFISKPPDLPDLRIYLASTDIPQKLKWQKRYISFEIENNFKLINKAMKRNFDVVVLPESAFPLFLNLHKDLMDKLKNLSFKIIIVTGALHYKNKKYFNSTYVFDKGKVKILDKHLLVPFGEYIPVPFFEKEINHIFFGDSSDYSTSKNFGEFEIKNYKFINAICYELTSEDLYKLKPNYVIGMSNLAWFKPSVIPSLQEMLIKIYARKYKKIVFHSINGFKSEIIR